MQKEDISHGGLAAWCVEGDNRGDAMGLAGVVLQVLGIGKLALACDSRYLQAVQLTS